MFLSWQQSASRSLTVLLLIALGTVLPGVQAMAAENVASLPHPAACHNHNQRQESPLKTPMSLQCCASGHDVAMPSAAFSPRQMDAQISAFDDVPVLPPVFFDVLHVTIFLPSASPPAVVPLRI